MKSGHVQEAISALTGNSVIADCGKLRASSILFQQFAVHLDAPKKRPPLEPRDTAQRDKWPPIENFEN